MKPRSLAGLAAAHPSLTILLAAALTLLLLASATTADRKAQQDVAADERRISVVDPPARSETESTERESGGTVTVFAQSSDSVPAGAAPAESEAGDDSGALATEPGARAGAEVFQNVCAVCHGSDGRGTIAPSLAGNSNLERSDYMLALILRGGDGMPAFHDRLSEQEIDAVGDYVRTAWGNDFGAVPRGQLVSQWWRGATGGDESYQRICARCHGPGGGGYIGPPLAQNENLSDPQYVVGKVLHGQGGMPAFEGLLPAEQVQELATYVRTAFGNDFGPVEKDLVNRLQRRGNQQAGELTATVTPSGSLFTLIGPDRQVRSTTEAGPGRFSGLVPGRYTVTASGSGYRAASQMVEIRPGQASRVTLNLEPLGEPSDGPRQVVVESPASAEPASSGDDDARNEYGRSCALCHGPQGEGGVGPPLAGNRNLQNAEFVAGRILHGSGRMPAFEERLSIERIAALAGHERSSWGNDFGKVTPRQVAGQRQSQEPLSEARSPESEGAAIYRRHCSVCHGSQGSGGLAPAFRGNEALRDLPYVLSRIVMGGSGMPPFGETLSSDEIAAVAALIRNSWGNEFGAVGTVQAQNYNGRPDGSSSMRRSTPEGSRAPGSGSTR